MNGNTLYYGDNLTILRDYFPNECVDLIYLDPPFNSKATYNVLFGERNGSQAAAQVKAFEDTWHWDQAAAEAYQGVVEASGRPSQAMQAFRTLLGDNDMLAYLAMMAPRLIELRRVLKPTGSIYLHCDPTASHYLKVLMDAVFEAKNFRNELVWHYSGWNKRLRHHFERRHDVILLYAQSRSQLFHSFSVPYESKEEYLQTRKQKLHTDDTGREYTLDVRHGGTRRVRVYVDEALERGRPIDDVWDIDKLNNSAKEYLGYPTQKPEALLERIIQASSNEGDLVLDPFCGCGTTVIAAQRLNRRWIGIDITHLAIGLMRHRLRDTFGGEAVYQVIGEPVSLPDAQALAESDPYQFQWWALGLVGARPVEQKKGADQGIDGRLYFHDEGKGGKTKQVILSVKAGHTTVSHLRDLRGVLDREGAEMGALITMQDPTKPMRAEAASAGFYQSPGWQTSHPRLQILTVAELLDGKQIDMPPIRQVSTTFKRAPRTQRKQGQQISMPLPSTATEDDD